MPLFTQGPAMKFSAATASRKWPCRGPGCGKRPMLTVLALCVALLAGAAEARSPASRDGFWPETRRPKQPVLVPLPKPRPTEAPAAENQDGNAKPAEAAAEPTAPPVSACRLALTGTIAIAPSIAPIHGPGSCGGDDLVRLEAVVLPDNRQVAVKPAAILRCPMAAALADWVRSDMAPLATSLGSTISDLDNFDSFECRGRNRVAGAMLSEHGRANALDIRAFKLADGRSISLTD